MPRDGTKNLIPLNQRTKEEQKKFRKKGGIKSGESRRRNKLEKDRLEILLSLTPDLSKDQYNLLQKMGIDVNLKVDNDLLVSLSLIQSALKGDIAAIKYIEEKIGRNPQLELKKEELKLRKKELELKDF